MKHFLILSFLFLSPLFIFAQDTIVKRNGEKMIVKIMEVNTDNIRYKKIDYIEGPLFMLGKQEIDFIVYGNGSRDSFSNYAPVVPKLNILPIDLTIQPSGKYYYYKEHSISERDMLAVAGKQNNKEIDLMIKSVEQKRLIEHLTCYGGIVLFVGGAFTDLKNQPHRQKGGRGGPGGKQTATPAQLQGQKIGEYLMLGALASEMVSIYFVFDKRKHAHILVNAYNKNLYMK